MELAGPQSDCVGYGALMSGDGFLVCIYMNTVPLQTVRTWEEVSFFLPHPVDNAAQNPRLEAESHVANNQRPCGKGHSRHSCKRILSDVQKWELPLFLKEVLVSHPIPLMRQTNLCQVGLSSAPFLQEGVLVPDNQYGTQTFVGSALPASWGLCSPQVQCRLVAC